MKVILLIEVSEIHFHKFQIFLLFDKNIYYWTYKANEAWIRLAA